MSNSYRKVKTVAKTTVPKGELLSKKVLSTMRTVANIVGATLGPGGCPARDASVRTAVEAGDGTTTATVLAEAIVRYTHQYCGVKPKVSSQRVVRILEKLFHDILEPQIQKLTIHATDEKVLHAVAKCSANGDQELADAVMECFKQTGDDGNVTIIERSGPSKYEVELLKGYPVAVGFEDSCHRFFPMFKNDNVNARCYLEKPLFILNFGTITEIQQLFGIMGDVGEAFAKWKALKNDPSNQMPLPPEPPRNIVLVTTGFSESVLAQLGRSFLDPDALRIVPLLVPRNAIQSGQLDFLQDLQAVTGATIFDPIHKPITNGKTSDMGYQLEYFEMHRYRSNIVGMGDESYLLARVEEVRSQIEKGGYESDLELSILKERLGKLTGGIAKLTVVGASNGEIREKKDRAEDAVCAVRGAIKHGCLPGGCWALLKLVDELSERKFQNALEVEIVDTVLIPALQAPFLKLLDNCGFNSDEVDEVLRGLQAKLNDVEPVVYDALDQKFVTARESGVMDSTPAVLEALRNSISIASLLGTLGGCVVFPRDIELERTEASDNFQFIKDANTPPEGE